VAHITIADENRKIGSPEEIAAFLKPFGILYERWGVERNVSPDASSEDILAAYAPEIEKLKKQGGYVTADVINVSPQTPNLDAMLAKFTREHTHTEDEVRFIVKGSGVFHIHPKGGPVFALQLDAGDLINVPRGTEHWFDLCADKTIRAIRLFQDATGWTPYYTESGIDARYQPVCWGPKYLNGETPRIAPVVQP
jgi:1,2-dihydroxy-3-keto-5-methylthiopentene dioxygenase